MCGRFTSLLTPELLKVIYEITAPVACEPHYNIAPTQQVLVVCDDFSGNRQAIAMYQQLADTWRIYDNSAPGSPRLLSTGERTIITTVVDAPFWDSLKGTYHG